MCSSLRRTSAQVADLNQQLAPLRDRLRHLSVTVMSVDAVQGRESDVAIFSVTRSNSRAELGFIGPDYWRRINVALSRARFGLTIVGDAGFIRGNDRRAEEGAVVRRGTSGRLRT